MKKSTGFTLIELLIVVAIIAILAAIAVPNFLEAQVRSKVSRSHADMRSIATAIESYAVDNNRPPLGMWEMDVLYTPTHDRSAIGSKGDEGMCDEQAYRIFGQLTTPIAYMTAVPGEVFTEKGAMGTTNANAYYRKVYTYQAASTLNCNSYDAGNGYATKNTAIIGMNGIGKSWMLAGHGPQRNLGGGPAKAVAEQFDNPLGTTDPGKLAYPGLYYDPTNGTVSFGYIIRSSAGIEPVRKK